MRCLCGELQHLSKSVLSVATKVSTAVQTAFLGSAFRQQCAERPGRRRQNDHWIDVTLTREGAKDFEMGTPVQHKGRDRRDT